MRQMTPTPHQQTAIDWVVERITSGVTAVALTGLAGTGKSTCIPLLQAALLAQKLPVTIGAPTHRAAMILRRKGLLAADTIHAHALTPYFKPVYACALDYLHHVAAGITYEPEYALHYCPTQQPYEAAEYCDTTGKPLLIIEAMAKHTRTLTDLRHIAQTGQHGPRKALESVGIQGSQYFDGFGPKLGEGVLIIDEASMVGAKTLAMCLEAFPQVVLIGDPGQLPPVKEDAVLATIDGVQLTEIHRQAGDSPIVQLAYAVRSDSNAAWAKLSCQPGVLGEHMAVPAAAFLTSPLIVWRNATRLSCTHAIRSALDYPEGAVVAGEPLVCRSSSQEGRIRGFFNNALYRVIKVLSSDPLRATVVPDGKEDDPDAFETIRLHLEELHGEAMHPDALPFRFGYCLTAHTAQGGEWGTVYIAKPDMLAYLGMCHKRGGYHLDDGARWAYTAITRAKQTLGFLLNYDFTTKEHVMPKMTEVMTEITREPQQSTFRVEADPDDIPELPLPLSMQQGPQAEPVTFHQVPGTVDPGTAAGQVVMAVDDALEKHTATLRAFVEQSRGDTLRAMQTSQQGLEALTAAVTNYRPVTPYSASVSVVSPSGYPMVLNVQNASLEGFMEQMSTMMQFLITNQFKAPQVPASVDEGIPF